MFVGEVEKYGLVYSYWGNKVGGNVHRLFSPGNLSGKGKGQTGKGKGRQGFRQDTFTGQKRTFSRKIYSFHWKGWGVGGQQIAEKQ